jgi:hypothetical protein
MSNELILYHLLSTRSRRAITKTTARFGRRYRYTPRRNLVERLSIETGMSHVQVYEKLYQERKILIENLF